MRNFREHIVFYNTPIKDALVRLDDLAEDAILFIVDKESILLGSLTDGDIRRGLIKGLSMDDGIIQFMQSNPKYLKKSNYSINDVISYRKEDYKVVPVVDAEMRIINVINFRYQQSYLPVDAVVMAGGLGTRLKPFTDYTPKPLLKVGEKCIIDHNVDRLRKFGVDDFWFSLRHLGEQIEDHYGTGQDRNISVNFVWEKEPLGTIGAVSMIENFKHDYVLVTNSDLLTTLNYEDFFLDFLDKDADMSVITIPYQVDVPYAVMETTDHKVISFKEKPTYTYYSNGGIYLIKREVLDRIPKNTFFNSTDLMENLIKSGGNLISYPNRQYWLDIGKPEDFKQAQEDIKHLKL